MAYALAKEMAMSGDAQVQAQPLGLDDIEGGMRLYRGRILRYAMFAVRDGSYSMVCTTALTPTLFRLKSMKR